MLDSYQRARHHAIVRDTPAVDFFAGALLGNGGLGVCVTTRPDGVMLHLGHNSVWDIRVAEQHQDQIGSFADIFAKVQAISADLGALEEDAWYKAYTDLMQQNYLASYPRPFPCGTLLLGLDRRRAEVLGYRLDIADGRCEVTILEHTSQRTILLQVFVDQHHDHVWMRTVATDGTPVPSPFERVRLLPDPTTPAEFPAYQVHNDGIGFAQRLPSQTSTVASTTHTDEYWKSFHATRPQSSTTIPPHHDDRAVSVALTLSSHTSTWQPQTSYGTPRPIDPLERAIHDHSAFVAVLELVHGSADQLPLHAYPTPNAYQSAVNTSTATWASYWRKSGFMCDDELLEQTWYRNLYFFNCAVSPDHTCPGLFANWSYRTIGNAWHGDYHMNYNTQQPFWLCFSSNHLEKHLAYVNLVDHLMPISQQWARDYYGLRGAYFPHSAYPTTMNVMPYPVPTWGWEICETPWTVQSLWWHYTYSMDVEFLRTRAYTPIRAAVQFLVDYMQRPEAYWDNTYHIYPTVSPELYGLTPGLHKNADCIVDLTLTKFVFNAFLQAVTILQLKAQEQALITAVTHILAHFPVYPTAATAAGDVFVSVPHEDPYVVYNVPSSTTPIFPGDEVGLHSPPELFATAARTLATQRNEGGNDLVFLNMQYARMGMLDIARFKRQIAYCTLPNGTCTDMVLQVHGRYSDDLPFDFMAPMGIWLENFALPAVINECVMQSYTGEIRLFPNWDTTVACTFEQLRAVGGFLVSASCAAGQVTHVRIYSDHGGTARVWSPWQAGQLLTRTLAAAETWEISPAP